MTESAIAITSIDSAADAGREIGQSILNKLNNKKPNAVLVFCSARYNYAEVLQGIRDCLLHRQAAVRHQLPGWQGRRENSESRNEFCVRCGLACFFRGHWC